MTSSKNKILGIITIAFVSLLQMIMVIALLSLLINRVRENALFFTDVSFPVVILLSIWRGRKVSEIMKNAQLSKRTRQEALQKIRISLVIITFIASVVCIIAFLVITHHQGIHLSRLFIFENSILPSTVFIIMVFGFHQMIADLLTSHLAFVMLKRIINN